MLHLLVNADVYAPEPLGRKHVLVAHGRIAAVLDTIPMLDESLAVETADLYGRRLAPGFVDGHVHVTGGGGEAGFETAVPPVPLSAFTLGGTTTVVGLLGTDDLTRTTSSLLARVRALRAEGLSAYAYTGGYHVPPATFTGSVRSDIVHLGPVIGCAEIAVSDHRSSQPTFDELARIASECHVAGLMTGKAGVLHLHLGDGARGLDLVRRALAETELPPRTFYPTHVNRNRRLFDEALALVPHGVTIDVTAFPVEDGEDAWSAEDALERYWNAGLPPERITVTTDAGGALPVFDRQGELVKLDYARPSALLATVQALLARGHALETVLPPFTANPARALRLHGKGRIEAGRDADFAVLDADGALTDVMARGAWHVRDGALVRKGTFE